MSNLNETSRGMRTAIAFLGRRNAGKSSLLNALVGYEKAIVSEIPGTTTDPVSRAVEISPLGPCMVIDTAGLDDQGILGAKRIEKTREVIKDCDVGLAVIGDGRWTGFEEELLQDFASRKKPLIIVSNKADIYDTPGLADLAAEKGLAMVRTSAARGEGISELKAQIRALSITGSFEAPSIVDGLVRAGDLVVLVVPIDMGAPKGRLILPQVQTIRAILDQDATAVTVKESGLSHTLDKLQARPDLVITDSQVVLEVARTVPGEIALTTFSTVFARFKGDIRHMAEAARIIDSLENGDRVLIAESCSHHPLADDIGRVKIPSWIRQYRGRDIAFDVAAGPSFVKSLRDYRLVIQCGGCTITRTAYNNRIAAARDQGVPITNYGLAISHVQGLLERVIRPFPEFLPGTGP